VINEYYAKDLTSSILEKNLALLQQISFRQDKN